MFFFFYRVTTNWKKTKISEPRLNYSQVEKKDLWCFAMIYSDPVNVWTEQLTPVGGTRYSKVWFWHFLFVLLFRVNAKTCIPSYDNLYIVYERTITNNKCPRLSRFCNTCFFFSFNIPRFDTRYEYWARVIYMFVGRVKNAKKLL